MKLETFTYTANDGWSVESLPALDSDATLVIVFGAPEWADGDNVFNQLLTAFSRSHVVGCSTAGEIFDTHLADRSLAVAACRFEHNTSVATATAAVRNPADSFAAGEALARQLDDPSLRAVLLFRSSCTKSISATSRMDCPRQACSFPSRCGPSRPMTRTWSGQFCRWMRQRNR